MSIATNQYMLKFSHIFLYLYQVAKQKNIIFMYLKKEINTLKIDNDAKLLLQDQDFCSQEQDWDSKRR